jgi:hypothetical protein
MFLSRLLIAKDDEMPFISVNDETGADSGPNAGFAPTPPPPPHEHATPTTDAPKF